VRLQHGGEAIYRDSLQVATFGTFLFGFRKIDRTAVQFLDLTCTITETADLRLANRAASAIGTASSATISANGGWDYQGVEK
jgi:hypothetical protein